MVMETLDFQMAKSIWVSSKKERSKERANGFGQMAKSIQENFLKMILKAKES